MSRRWSISLALFVLGILFASSTLVASADTFTTSVHVYCNQFIASGTSSAPYVTLYAYNEDTAEDVFTVVPVTGGTFSGSVSYPNAPEGTVFDVDTWGSLNPYTNLTDPGYWDSDDDYYDDDVPCTPAPPSDACTYPLPTNSIVYDVPLGAQAYFAPDTQSSANFILPAGTWKISEFKDDFAKVWIACEATPIWISKVAVGGAVA